MSGPILGMNAVIYNVSSAAKRNGNTLASYTYGTKFRNVTNVTLNQSSGTADVTTRSNSGYRAQIATLKEITAEFEMIVDSSDPDYQAVANAYYNDDNLCLAILSRQHHVSTGQNDTAYNGAGPVADWAVTGFNRTEPLEDAIKLNVTLVSKNLYVYDNGKTGENANATRTAAG